MKSDFERRRQLDLRYGDGTYTKPATVYIALCTTEPTSAGGGTEVVGGGSTNYARVAVTNDLANFPDAITASGITSKSNANEIAFNVAGTNWGTIAGIKVFDDPSAGNLLDFYVIPIADRITINTGGQFVISAGQFIITEK